jgi:hypothetical protein
MKNTPVQILHTNSADEFSGTVWGLSAPLIVWVVAAAGLSLLLFLLLREGLGTKLPLAVSSAALPVILCVTYLVFFHQGKPASYARDLAEHIANRGDVADPNSSGRSCDPFFNPLPDVEIVGGLVFFGGPRVGGQVAKGFCWEPPDLRVASDSERDRFSSYVRQLIGIAIPNYGLFVQWTAESDYEVELRSYAADTERTGNALVRKARNETFLACWNAMENRHLRRERVMVFVGRVIESSAHSGIPDSHASHLSQLQAEFREIGQTISAVLGAHGGRFTPLTESQHLEHLARRLNPSLAERPDIDIQKWHDPTISLLDGFWQSELRGERT